MPLAMPLIIGGATLASGLIGANAASNASQQQYGAAMAGLQFQQQMYSQNRHNLQPWITSGTNANNSLAAMYGFPGSGNENRTADYSSFLNSPDYQFAQQQGLRAVDQSAASRGLLQSGGQARAVQQFGQGLAGQQFGNYFQRMLSMSQYGMNAASSLAGVSTQAGSNISNSYGNAGQALASGTIGGANAVTGALGSGVNNLMMYSALNRSPSSYAGGMQITAPQVGNYAYGGGAASGGNNGQPVYGMGNGWG